MKTRAIAFAGILLALFGFTGRASAVVVAPVDYDYDFFFTIKGEMNFLFLDLQTAGPASSTGTPIMGISGALSFPSFSLFGPIIGPAGPPAENKMYASPSGAFFHSISFGTGGFYVEITDPPSFDTFDICIDATTCTPGAGFAPLFTGLGELDPTPLPAALPLFAAVLGLIGALGRWRRRSLTLATP